MNMQYLDMTKLEMNATKAHIRQFYGKQGWGSKNVRCRKAVSTFHLMCLSTNQATHDYKNGIRYVVVQETPSLIVVIYGKVKQWKN